MELPKVNEESDKFEDEIKDIIDKDNEIYPIKINEQLNNLWKEHSSVENKKKVMLIELALINPIFSPPGRIGNIWEDYSKRKDNFLLPFDNLPFCKWETDFIDYYKKRYSQTKAFFPKARYSFAIMTLSKGNDKLTFAKETIKDWTNLFTESSKKFEEDKGNFHQIDLAIFSTRMAFKTALAFGEALKKEVIDFSKILIEKISSTKNELLLIRLVEQMISFKEEMTKYNEEILFKEKTEAIINNLKLIKDQLIQNKTFHFARDYLASLSLLCEPEKAGTFQKEIAETFILEAENNPNPSVKSAFYHDAIKFYQSLLNGCKKEEKSAIQERIKDLTKLAEKNEQNVEYSSFSHTIEIKKEDIEKLVADIAKIGKKPLENLLLYKFIPNKEFTLNETSNQKRLFPLGFIITNSVQTSFGLIAKYSTDEEIFNFKYRKNLSLGIIINQIYLRIIWEELINASEKEIDLEVGNIFNELPDLKELFVKAYNFFKVGDFVSPIHLLIPYVEEIIRRILKEIGPTDLTLKTEKERYFRKIELGGLIKDKQIRPILGEDLCETLDCFLCLDDQINLRNLLSHGLISKKELSKENNLYLIYIILKLILILKAVKKDETKN